MLITSSTDFSLHVIGLLGAVVAFSDLAFQPCHPSPLVDLPPLSIATAAMQVNACTQRGNTICFWVRAAQWWPIHVMAAARCLAG
jgi:hypothetical protein